VIEKLPLCEQERAQSSLPGCRAPEQFRTALSSPRGAAHPQVPPHGAGLRSPPISSVRPGPPIAAKKPERQWGVVSTAIVVQVSNVVLRRPRPHRV
jgi:hypothetical protein